MKKGLYLFVDMCLILIGVRYIEISEHLLSQRGIPQRKIKVLRFFVI